MAISSVKSPTSFDRLDNKYLSPPPTMASLTPTEKLVKLEELKTELIEQAMQIGALKFGSFTLKSGRCVMP